VAGCVESRAELHRVESRVYQLSCIGHRAEEEEEEKESLFKADAVNEEEEEEEEEEEGYS
jgi:hypothetical protein